MSEEITREDFDEWVAKSLNATCDPWMTLRKLAQNVASDVLIYGAGAWTCGDDGTIERVDPDALLLLTITEETPWQEPEDGVLMRSLPANHALNALNWHCMLCGAVTDGETSCACAHSAGVTRQFVVSWDQSPTFGIDPGDEVPRQEPPQEKPDILAYFAIEIATMGISDQRAALQRMMDYCQTEMDAIAEGEAVASAVRYPGTWPPPRAKLPGEW